VAYSIAAYAGVHLPFTGLEPVGI